MDWVLYAVKCVILCDGNLNGLQEVIIQCLKVLFTLCCYVINFVSNYPKNFTIKKRLKFSIKLKKPVFGRQHLCSVSHVLKKETINASQKYFFRSQDWFFLSFLHHINCVL